MMYVGALTHLNKKSPIISYGSYGQKDSGFNFRNINAKLEFSL